MSVMRMPTKRFRVLVVDDDQSVLNSLCPVLDDDCDVTACVSAPDAVDLVARFSFHVVVSDFAMPKINGLELLRRVSMKAEYTSCLLLTGSDRYRAEDASRYYVLLKPFDPARLINMVLQLGRVAEMKRSVERLATTVSRGPTCK